MTKFHRMKIFNTTIGIFIEHRQSFYLHNADWDEFVNDDRLLQKMSRIVEENDPTEKGKELLKDHLLPPIGSQEVWASGVTYYRSREARMDEAKEAGGDDFYNRVYEAERPELFFKATAHRTVGSGQKVRIRKDSKWNVPEPELTLFLGSSGKILGYTAGNDMSSRDIEGENPLYLPQAKTYDKSAAIGPGIFVTNDPLSPDTNINMNIIRSGKSIFEDNIPISQIKREFTTLAEFLYLESTFPHGCFLMTGTGIVPQNEFTLHREDEIHITIDQIGTLINHVE